MFKKHSQKNQQALGNILRVILKTVVWGYCFYLGLSFSITCAVGLSSHICWLS